MTTYTTPLAGTHCHYCNAPFTRRGDRRKTADHKTPMARGGKYDMHNIVAACYLCNHEKANMTEAEYAEWKRLGRPNRIKHLQDLGLIPASTRKTGKPGPMSAADTVRWLRGESI